ECGCPLPLSLALSSVVVVSRCARRNLERRVSLAPLSPDVISPPQDENRKASRKSRADYWREQRTGQSHGAGARLVLASRNLEQLNETAAAVRKLGADALVVQADV